MASTITVAACFFTLFTAGCSAKVPHENNSFSFSLSAGVPTCFGKSGCFSNHPTYLGDWDARNHAIYIDGNAKAPKTSCPKKVRAHGECPPKPDTTGFNTTNIPPISGDSATKTGKVFMNSVLLQQLYVASDGLLQYATAEQPSTIPEGAYGGLFNFQPFTIGSCLNCIFAMQFNYTDFYTCFNQVPGLGNLTYAATATNAKFLKKCSQYYAIGGPFCTTKIPDSTCGPNAYEYD